MSTLESEYMLENKMISVLKKQGYQYEKNINLKKNLKKQLEKLNKVTFSESEFNRILIYLKQGNILQKFKKLRDLYSLELDNGKKKNIKLIDFNNFCKNIFQVSNQIENGRHRYDITILVNGFPLVQIELKRRGGSLKEAFGQIKRYQKESYWFDHGLFNYIQLFVISNGMNTQYFANNIILNESFKFYWSDKDNNRISELFKFTDNFMEPHKIIYFLKNYIVLSEKRSSIIAMRPYQFYAVEAINLKVKTNSGNGFVWHTTGSGKTLTSFKASDLISKNREVEKVIFLVDRRDLDNQTLQEFNDFSSSSIEATESTKRLKKQFLDPENKLIITTIHKFVKMIRNFNENTNRYVFIIDECHRTQDGTFHSEIKRKFINSQFIGFTGTPIFKENNNNLRTTTELFGEILHKYLIKEAIFDKNVLPFHIDFFEGGSLENICEYIVENHNRLTLGKRYNALLAVSGKESVLRFYRELKDSCFKVSAIYSLDQNNFENREGLLEFINDHNERYGTSFSLDTYSDYHTDISRKMKAKEIDILIVSDMFLTGFDSPKTNTIYLDKELEYHNLIQSFSRTNRIDEPIKEYGNIVSFNDIRENVEKAIALFADSDNIEDIIAPSYEEFYEKFQEDIKALRELALTPESVDNLMKTEDIKNFIKISSKVFRDIAILKTYVEFKEEDFPLQTIENYKSKYLDLRNEIRRNNEKEISEEDFELSYIGSADINLDYLCSLFGDLKESPVSEKEEKTKRIIDLVKSSVELKPYEPYINDFISYILDNNTIINSDNEIELKFMNFIQFKQKEDLKDFCEKNEIDIELFKEFIKEISLREGYSFKNFDIRKKFKIKDRDIIEKIHNKTIEILEIY